MSTGWVLWPGSGHGSAQGEQFGKSGVTNYRWSSLILLSLQWSLVMMSGDQEEMSLGTQRSDGIEEMMGNFGNEKKELYFSSVKAEMEQSGWHMPIMIWVLIKGVWKSEACLLIKLDPDAVQSILETLFMLCHYDISGLNALTRPIKYQTGQ